MAEQEGKLEKTSEKGSTSQAGESKPKPFYFLSLSLENARCFGPKQTLKLSDSNNRPSRWTIVLGLNGTGKTTVLQSLVGLEPLPLMGDDSLRLRPRIFYPHEENFVRAESQEAIIGAEFASLATLTASTAEIKHVEAKIGRGGNASLSPRGFELWCCGYGAGRRVGMTSLTGTSPDDPTESLFTDRAELLNPEEWLLQLDYAASKPSNFQSEQKKRLVQANQLLLRILPEIKEIRLVTPEGIQPRPRAELGVTAIPQLRSGELGELG